MGQRQKPCKKKPPKKQAGEFLCDICGPIGLQLDNRFAFLLATKRDHHKSPRVLLHLTLCKAYVLPSCLYSVHKMDCRGPIESIPAHLTVLQCLQTKPLVRGLPFLGLSLFPLTLCHFRHATLMFQTHFSNVLHSI